MEPSLDTRDAPCPYCGHHLWFDSEDTRRSLQILAAEIRRVGPARTDKILKMVSSRSRSLGLLLLALSHAPSRQGEEADDE
jgi:hypothetical protein